MAPAPIALDPFPSQMAETGKPNVAEVAATTEIKQTPEEGSTKKRRQWENGTTHTKTSYDAIPGPLGLSSASLEGKVALVTGAGE